MTGEQLKTILTSNQEIDPWLVEHFFQPLFNLVDTAAKRYTVQSPPRRYWEGREFAIGLWECRDDEAMRALVGKCEEGASQLCYMLSVLVMERQLVRPVDREGVVPTGAKPFAALASRALEWLDEIEAKAPGKTEPPE